MKVKLKQFEGPLELLLQLIEQEKLSVTEIALAEVTDQYLSVISDQEIDAAHLADFLLIASRLLLIKSKTLLPFLELSSEEEEEIRQFTFSLQEYQRYKHQAEVLKKLWQGEGRCLGRDLWQGRGQYFFPPPSLSLISLRDIFQRLLVNWETFVSPREERILKKSVTIEEKINQIIQRLQDGASRGLRVVAGNQADKLEVILCFLAVLFLFRQKLVTLKQSSYDSEVIIQGIHS
jgi:segregation and condensation protein A